MNRIEELELTVQMLLDRLASAQEQDYDYDYDKIEEARVNATAILTNRPCSCAELPFPHKRTRACFRRY